MNFDFELLQRLCCAHGVSGYEDETSELVAQEIKDACEYVLRDSLGNIIAFKKGRKTPQKPIMLCAHLDEVGFAIKHINDDGTLDFSQVGMTSTVLPSKRVLVSDKKIPGFVSARPIHLSHDKSKACKQSDLVIDIGAVDKKQAQSFVSVGDYAVFDSEYVSLGENFIKSKALDDRIGCAVMCMLAKAELENDVYLAFTVGEELGGVGAVAATNRIKPDICLVLEGTTASDLAGYAEKDKVCCAGLGAVTPYMDNGTMYDKDLYALLQTLAKKNGIKVQTKTKVAGGTDASKIQRTNLAVKVAALSLACRYIHTGASVASREDMQGVLDLAYAFVNSL